MYFRKNSNFKAIQLIIIILLQPILLFALINNNLQSEVSETTLYTEDLNILQDYKNPESSLTEEFTKFWERDDWGHGYDIVADSSGNIFVTGVADIDPSGGIDWGLVLIKFDSSGNEIWNSTYGYNWASGQAVDLDNSGNIYVAGSTTDYGAGGDDACLIKFNSTGGIEWNVTWGSADGEMAYGVGVDSNEDIFMSGYKTDWSTYYDIFLVKYNSSGHEQWNVNFTTSEREECYDLAVDEYDYIYLSGRQDTMIGAGIDYEYLAVKFDNESNQIWNITHQIKDSPEEKGYSIAVDSLNNTYVAGLTEDAWGYDELGLVKFNETGDYQWEAKWGVPSTQMDEEGRGVCVDGADNIYVTGFHEQDLVVVKFNSTGSQVWNITYNGGSIEKGMGIYVDSGDSIYVTGYRSPTDDLILQKYSKEFTLSTIDAQDPDNNGYFSLSWEICDDAINYTIYKFNRTITEINGSLDIIDKGNTNRSFVFTGLPPGDYYYRIVGFGNGWNQSSQNYVYVNVTNGPPEPFTLNTIGKDNPDPDGAFTLNWSATIPVDNYSVYFRNSADSITENDIEVANGLTNLTYFIDGMYNWNAPNFAIFAYNEYGSTRSNQVNYWATSAPNVKPWFFDLYSNVTGVDSDGNFHINFTASTGASSFSLYMYDEFFFDINSSMTKIVEGNTNRTVPVQVNASGRYFFRAVAFNANGNRTTKCLWVDVEIGPPGAFSLNHDATNPDFDDSFNLIWTSSISASNYTIYNCTIEITTYNSSVDKLHEGLSNNSYLIQGMGEGTHFFTVVAFNPQGNYSSNCVNITIQYSPNNFTLNSTADPIDTVGIFNLTWTASLGANSYYIYRYHTNITDINWTLTEVESNYVLITREISGLTNGTYYFIVVAVGFLGNTSSNCIEIIIQIPGTGGGEPDGGGTPPPTTDGIPLGSYYLLFILIGIASVVVLKNRKLKKIDFN